MSRRVLSFAVPCFFMSGMLSVGALASGSGPMPMGGGGGGPRASSVSPQDRAAQRYNSGLKSQEKGDDALKEAVAETDAKKKDKIEAESKKYYGKAQDAFEDAVRLDSQNYQAYGALGYVRRRLGDNAGSLLAYESALKLKPNFTPAIEYRGETYLGLNRIEDAKQAYMALFASDRPKADMLVEAMKSWLDARRKDPAGVSPQTLDEFGTWLQQRQEVATHTSALLPPKDAHW